MYINHVHHVYALEQRFNDSDDHDHDDELDYAFKIDHLPNADQCDDDDHHVRRPFLYHVRGPDHHHDDRVHDA